MNNPPKYSRTQTPEQLPSYDQHMTKYLSNKCYKCGTVEIHKYYECCSVFMCRNCRDEHGTEHDHMIEFSEEEYDDIVTQSIMDFLNILDTTDIRKFNPKNYDDAEFKNDTLREIIQDNASSKADGYSYDVGQLYNMMENDTRFRFQHYKEYNHERTIINALFLDVNVLKKITY